jgi:excinuclease ABC subunit B
MRKAMAETERRRELQQRYNQEHGIDPQGIKKQVNDLVAQFRAESGVDANTPMGRVRTATGKTKRSQRLQTQLGSQLADSHGIARDGKSSKADLEKLSQIIQEEMLQAAAELRFEYAALLRDELHKLQKDLRDLEEIQAI